MPEIVVEDARPTRSVVVASAATVTAIMGAHSIVEVVRHVEGRIAQILGLPRQVTPRSRGCGVRRLQGERKAAMGGDPTALTWCGDEPRGALLLEPRRPGGSSRRAAAGVARRGAPKKGEARLAPCRRSSSPARRASSARLAQVAAGRAFLLQAGDCAESFHEFSADSIRDKLKIILQMAAVLTYARRAGPEGRSDRRSVRQAALGRNEPTGDGSCRRSAATWSTTRPSRSRRARRTRCAWWPPITSRRPRSTCCVPSPRAASPTSPRCTPGTSTSSLLQRGPPLRALASEIERALRFMAACGIDLGAEQAAPGRLLHEPRSSHPRLRGSLTRRDSFTGDWYDCSAHMVWIGDRTRQLDGAHLEFLSGIDNPIGFKIGPDAAPGGRGVVRAARPGAPPGPPDADRADGGRAGRRVLPPLLRAAEAAGHLVVWACDPMHGNTFTSDGGRKTRHFDAILRELGFFFDVRRDEGTWPGGVHVELTGDDVTECLGGSEELVEEHLDARYATPCDPRLNARQALDLAFRLAEFLDKLIRRLVLALLVTALPLLALIAVAATAVGALVRRCPSQSPRRPTGWPPPTGASSASAAPTSTGRPAA